MDDRTLLELSAKACGMTLNEALGKIGRPIRLYSEWNPLADDGDAMRLAVMLGMNVYTSSGVIMAEVIHSGDLPSTVSKQPWKGKDGKVVATRRAIVSAAAEIGKNMK